MRFLSICLLAGICVSPAAAALPEGPGRESACGIVPSASTVVSKLYTAPFAEAVQCRIFDHTEMERHTEKMMRREIGAEKLEGEERQYRMLGMIPYDFPYAKNVALLYARSVAGLYDATEDFLALLRSAEQGVELDTILHELVHALQDQHFDMRRYFDQSLPSDELLARSAVAEGQAMIVEQSARKDARYKELLGKLPPSTQEKGEILSPKELPPFPDSMRKLFSFPYDYGESFVRYGRARPEYPGPEIFFRRPPRSSAEILHPERYWAGVEVPELSVEWEHPGLKGVRRIFTDRLGEFALRTLIGTVLPEAHSRAAAEGWTTDRLVLLAGEPAEKSILIWEIAMKSEMAAHRLSLALRRFIEARFEPGRKMLPAKAPGRAPLVSYLNADRRCVRLVVANGQLEEPVREKVRVPQCRVARLKMAG
jgi:hypothetical protein